MLTRVLATAAALIAAAGIAAAGSADAAPRVPPRGFLIETVDGAVVATLPPGQAVRAVTTLCAMRGTPVAAPVTVDAVRLAFPAPFTACAGVTLTSQVAADAAAAQ